MMLDVAQVVVAKVVIFVMGGLMVLSVLVMPESQVVIVVDGIV